MSGGANGVMSTIRVDHPPTMPAPPTIRVRSVSELPFHQPSHQFCSAFTDHFTDLVARAIRPCPKNYSYDSPTRPSSSGRCPAAYPAFKYGGI